MSKEIGYDFVIHPEYNGKYGESRTSIREANTKVGISPPSFGEAKTKNKEEPDEFVIHPEIKAEEVKELNLTQGQPELTAKNVKVGISPPSIREANTSSGQEMIHERPRSFLSDDKPSFIWKAFFATMLGAALLVKT